MVTRGLAVSLLALGLTACQLDPTALYACSPDGGCLRDDYSCVEGLCVPDETLTDGGTSDAGGTDAGPGDAGTKDGGGSTDAGVKDAGVPDAGELDAGVLDAGMSDAGAPDAGPVCNTAVSCSGISCGFVDAGAGCSPLFCKYCAPGSHCGVTGPNQCSPALLCEGDWCWENLTPQGNTLRGAWARSRREVYFVGDFATVLRFDGEKYELLPVPIPRSVHLEAVHGNEDRVVVVGTRGTVLSLEGGQWRDLSRPNSDFHGVAVLPRNLGGDIFVVGDEPASSLGAAARWTPGGAWSPVGIVPNTDFRSVAVSTDGGTILALSAGPPSRIYRFDSSVSDTFSFVTDLGGEGRQLVAEDNFFYALTRGTGPDGGTQSLVHRSAGSFASPTIAMDVPGDGTALAVQTPGFAYVVTRSGQLFRGAAGNPTSTDITAGSDTDGLYAVAMLESNHPLMGGADGKLGVCRPPCTDGGMYALLSTGTSRDQLRACGTERSRFTLVAGNACGGGTCSVRFMNYGTSFTGHWDFDDVSNVSPDAGAPLTCLDLGVETLGLTQGGFLFRRDVPAGAEFQPAGAYALGGRAVAAFAAFDEGTDFDRTVYVLTDQNRVWAFPDGGDVSGLASVGLGTQPQQNTLWGVRWNLFATGNAGSSVFIERPAQTTLGYTTASVGGTASQRDLHGTMLLDGGELLVSVGDRGSVWYRNSDAGFRSADAGFTRQLTAVWTAPSGLVVIGTDGGEVLYGDPASGGWTSTRTLTGYAINDLWGFPVTDGGTGYQVWAIGKNGTIITRSIP